MKSNLFVLMSVPVAMIMAFLISGCTKDDTEDNPEEETPPELLCEIDDYGYTYGVCKGTFKPGSDTTLLLDGVYISDVMDEPTYANRIVIHSNQYGHGTIKILKDTLGQIDFKCVFIELENNTKYYVRCAYTKNETDTLYSDALTFTTKLFKINSIEFNNELTYGQVSDIENNTYKTIKIGTQTWTAENLKTTKFNNGTSIPLFSSVPGFTATTGPACCNFENDEVLSAPLGKLYNWHAIEEQNICPSGWHVAYASDWDVLDEYARLNHDCSGKALASKAGWMEAFYYDCNVGNDFTLNNGSGFTAIAAGALSQNAFGGFGHAAVWWSPKKQGGDYLPSSRYLTRDNSSIGVNSTEDENKGYSVRCIKN